MAMINELALRAYYQNNRDHYLRRRNSGDKQLWDEGYKWSILPLLNKTVKANKAVDGENISKIVEVFVKSNPSQGSFAHWIDMDDLKLLAEKRTASKS